MLLELQKYSISFNSLKIQKKNFFELAKKSIIKKKGTNKTNHASTVDAIVYGK